MWKEQSGFRAQRQTTDNLLTICQHNFLAFNKKKQKCVDFFDISKSFDKVCHLGLLYKMNRAKFEDHLLFWIEEFLN
jgi:hypothetical protein